MINYFEVKGFTSLVDGLTGKSIETPQTEI